jgi:hypothetical protein
MNKLLFENESLSIHFIIGKGVVLVLPKEWRDIGHCMNDEWILEFDDHFVSAMVVGLERFGYYGLVCGLILRMNFEKEDMSKLRCIRCDRLNVHHNI